MAPMIDMVFLLLVFFMTVSSLADDLRPELELPESIVVSARTEAPPRLVISLTADGIQAGAQACSIQTLPDILDAHSDWLEQSGCVLRIPYNVPYRDWQPILHTLFQKGIGQLQIAAYEAS